MGWDNQGLTQKYKGWGMDSERANALQENETSPLGLALTMLFKTPTRQKTSLNAASSSVCLRVGASAFLCFPKLVL